MEAQLHDGWVGQHHRSDSLLPRHQGEAGAHHKPPTGMGAGTSAQGSHPLPAPRKVI